MGRGLHRGELVLLESVPLYILLLIFVQLSEFWGHRMINYRQFNNHYTVRALGIGRELSVLNPTFTKKTTISERVG